MRFNRSARSMSVSLSCRCRKVVAPRIELSATRVSGGFGRPALDYRVVMCEYVGHLGVEPPVAEPPTNENSLLLPKQACFHLHLYPMLFVVFVAADSVGAYLLC